jgi:DNA invertase Pin-like site-specific DNA recombinase
VIADYYDAAVSGADPIDTRAGFAAMLEHIEGNGVRTIIVETASRFARDLMVQEAGFAMLQGRGIELIAADNSGSFWTTHRPQSLSGKCWAQSASLKRP